MDILKLKLGDFDGPFDLLLTLVKENKMDIQDMNLLTIADQYLNFVYAHKDLEINEASEYLYIASTLVWIKSKTILGLTIKLSDEEQTEIEAERRKLINQILLYKKYRDLVPKLNSSAYERSRMFAKSADNVETILGQKVDKEILRIPNQISFDALQKAMQRAYDRWKLNIFNNRKIVVQEVSAEQVEMDILDILNNYPDVKRYSLTDFFQVVITDIASVQYLVTCFVCLLDLAKNGKIQLTQNNFEDEIYINIM